VIAIKRHVKDPSYVSRLSPVSSGYCQVGVEQCQLNTIYNNTYLLKISRYRYLVGGTSKPRLKIIYMTMPDILKTLAGRGKHHRNSDIVDCTQQHRRNFWTRILPHFLTVRFLAQISRRNRSDVEATARR
jgi:hypothetical protein